MSRQAGFTLVEMIVAIVVGGILVSLTSMFVRGQIQAYFDVSNRAALADDADTAVRRIAREIAGALPNSVRTACLPAGACTDYYLEFIPANDGGRYRAEKPGDELDFSDANDKTFNVLGPQVIVPVGAELVIYNLGILGADAYATGESRRGGLASSVVSGVQTLSFTGAQFSLASPSSRFQIVTQPVSYVCRMEQGKRVISRKTGYGFNLVQPTGTAFGVNDPLLADNVKTCTFAYDSGVLERGGLVSIALTLTIPDESESVTLQHQVVVDNTP